MQKFHGMEIQRKGCIRHLCCTTICQPSLEIFQAAPQGLEPTVHFAPQFGGQTPAADPQHVKL